DDSVTGAPAAIREPAAELAAESFVDATFVADVARRIAEWARGGATLSVALIRLLNDVAHPDQTEELQRSNARRAEQAGRTCLRDMDLLTRWGPDGLAVLLPGATATDARVVSRRLHAAFARTEEENLPPLSACIGIAEGIEGNDASRVLM